MKTIREYVGNDIFFGLILSLATVFLLSGCATKDKPTAEDAMKAGLIDGAIAAAKAPLFKLTCPATGCVIASLEVGNPSGAAQLSESIKVAMTPQHSEASSNFQSFMGALSHLGGYAIIGHAASSIMGKITDGYVGIAKQIQAPGAITTTTTTLTSNTSNTNTLSGTGVLGSGTYTAPISTITNPTAKQCVVIPATATTPASLTCN